MCWPSPIFVASLKPQARYYPLLDYSPPSSLSLFSSNAQREHGTAKCLSTPADKQNHGAPRWGLLYPPFDASYPPAFTLRSTSQATEAHRSPPSLAIARNGRRSRAQSTARLLGGRQLWDTKVSRSLYSVTSPLTVEPWHEAWSTGHSEFRFRSQLKRHWQPLHDTRNTPKRSVRGIEPFDQSQRRTTSSHF
jgi:hypothetical protein